MDTPASHPKMNFFHLRVGPDGAANSEGSQFISLGITSTYPVFPKLLDYLTLEAHNAGEVFFPRQTFLSFLNQGKAALINDQRVDMRISFQWDASDVMFSVRFDGNHIAGSPQVLSMRQDASFHHNQIQHVLRQLEESPGLAGAQGRELLGLVNGTGTTTGPAASQAPVSEPGRRLWTEVEGLNPHDATRSGKSIQDLDASDMKSMGYDTTVVEPNDPPCAGLSTVNEESESGSPLKLPAPPHVVGLISLHSPRSSQHLPLNVPSPHMVPPQAAPMAAEIPHNHAFTPREASTVTNLERQLRRANQMIPSFPDVEPDQSENREEDDTVVAHPDEHHKGQVEVIKARTKVVDGEMAMAKSLLDHQNGLAGHGVSMNSTGGTDNSSIYPLNLEEPNHDIFQGAVRSQESSPLESPENTIDSWNSSRAPKVNQPPMFDLANKRTGLGLFRSFAIPGVPQSVIAVRGNRLLVTDIEHNKIWSIDCVTRQSDSWAPEVRFEGPRYIQGTLYDRVVVMDNKFIYIFNLDGSLVRKIFEGEAHRFRGLAFDQEYGRLVTTETNSKGIYIVFIDVEKTRDIVSVIKVEDPNIDLSSSKVRYVTCKNGLVVATDLGLGQIYVVKLKDQTSRLIKSHFEGSNRLKQASGVAIDPAGNILVGSMAHGKLQLVKPDGTFGRTFQPSTLGTPGGILIFEGSICVIDCKKKQLHMFLATEI
eukprot:maker-scaffold712_size108441-snap-gene-0.34 protein:Tk06091 transcript:maker-scaffold712_size108441-snap-gene-0.34-mRNA-1 annotation:"hypothetical protein BRAFLDRAFT_227409"